VKPPFEKGRMASILITDDYYKTQARESARKRRKKASILIRRLTPKGKTTKQAFPLLQRSASEADKSAGFERVPPDRGEPVKTRFLYFTGELF